MKRTVRFAFLMLVLLTCIQLTGLEEAFCEDSASESGCQDCLTCVGHYFAGIVEGLSMPAFDRSGYTFLNDTLHISQQPPLNLLRPPIVR